MHRTLILVALIVASVASVATPAVAQPLSSAVASLEDGLRYLDGAIATLERSKPSRAKDSALQQMALARARLVETLNALRHVPSPVVIHERMKDPPPPRPEPRPLPAAPLPMESGTFRDLLDAIKDLPFSKDQLSYLRDASRHHRFVTDQVRQVVGLFTFGKDKVEAAAMLYPRTLDRENFYQVQKEMEFESDRDALRKRLGEIDRAGLPAGNGP